MVHRTSIVLAIVLAAAGAGCTLIVSSDPKRSDPDDVTTDPDVMEIPDIADTGPETPDVPEDFVPACTATAVNAGGSGPAGCTCGLFETGRVMCWGSNEGGRLGVTGIDASPSPVDPEGLTADVGLLDAGSSGSCVVDGAGALWCWGATFGAVPATVTVGAGVVDVAVGNGFGCAALETGEVECFGEPAVTELVGTHTTSAAARKVCAGSGHVCALVEGGSLQCWGDNAFGQVGNGVSGAAETRPRDVAGLTGVVHVACGRNHTCAALDDGTAWCWGENLAGQLGDGTTEGKASPVQVTSLGSEDATMAAAGRSHSCVLIVGGQIRCWGENDRGQLGDGSMGVASAIARDVVGLVSAATQVTAGGDHSCALLDTGALMCWGRNTSGELGDGTATSWDVPVWVQADCP